MQQKKFIASTLIVIAIFAAAFYLSRKNDTATKEIKQDLKKVTVQSSRESKFLLEKISYPATVVGQQEVAIVAQTSGIITSIPYEIGTYAKAGSLLARIDDTGSQAIGENGFKSSQIQQSELSAKQAKKSLGLSKDVYHNTKTSDGSTKIAKETAKTQKEIAQLQYEVAKINLQSSIDNHHLTVPLNGYIISKNVSVGDYVSPGQVVATVSRTAAVKIQFYVDQTDKTSFRTGQVLVITNSDKKEFSATVKNIAVQADPQTMRFLVEAYPLEQNLSHLLLGTVVTASIEKKQTPLDSENYIVPLSTITITQNESYIFVAENDRAKKIAIEIKRIMGENAEISASLAGETPIIIKGNKVLREGESVSIENNS